MFNMEFSKEFSYNFIDVYIFSSSDLIPRHLKSIALPFFLVKKYDRGTKTVKF